MGTIQAPNYGQSTSGAQTGSTLANLLRTIYSLALAPPSIVPGQPVSTKWRWQSGETGLTSGQAQAVFSVFQGPGQGGPAAGAWIPLLAPVVVPLSFNGLYADTGPQTTQVGPPANPLAAALLYLTAMNQVQLAVTVTGQTSDGTAFSQTYTLTASLNVQAELVDSSWFSWDTLGGSTFEWDNPFIVKGTLTNKSVYANMTAVTLDFDITDSTGQETSAPESAPSVDVPMSTPNSPGTATVASPTLQFNWQWMNQTDYLIDGPIWQSFGIVLQFTLRDQFGNFYRPITSAPLGFQVIVSAAKLSDESQASADFQVAAGAASVAAGVGIAAAVTSATGIGAVICGIILAVAGAVAAGFQAAANGAAQNANDPLPPDPNTRAVEEPSRLSWAPERRLSPRARDATEFARSLIQINNLRRALVTTGARLKGAELWGDEEGRRMQLRAAARIIAALKRSSASLPRQAKRASHELSRAFAALTVRENRLLQDDLVLTMTPAVRSSLFRVGIPASLVPPVGARLPAKTIIGNARALPLRMDALAATGQTVARNATAEFKASRARVPR